MNDRKETPFAVMEPMGQPMGEVCPMAKPGKSALWSSVVTLVL